MAHMRRAIDNSVSREPVEDWPEVDYERPLRKEQITIRLDPGMVADARTIAARKGIGHHTLLRMWVMEGIVRAYEDGVLDGPPRSWRAPARTQATIVRESAQR
jgi:hypothetical protein